MMQALRIVAVALGCGCAGTTIVPDAAGGNPTQTAQAVSATARSPSATPSTPAVTPRRVGSPYAYEWFVRAELLRARGDLPHAIEAYRAALSSSDEDPYVLTRLATALDAAGARSQAEAALSEALAHSPWSEAAWLARAEIAQHHDEREQAFEAYERAESAAPHSAQAPLELSKLLLQLGQPERARAVLLRYEARVLPSVAGASRARLSRALLQRDGANAYAEALAQLRARQPDVDAVLHAATLLVEQSHCALALNLLAAIPPRPDHAALRLRALSACAEYAAAEQLLATTDPELYGGLLATARAYLAIGRAPEALVLAESYRASHPEELEALLVVAQAKLATGAYAEAADLFARVPMNARGSAEARSGLAQALEARGLPELASEVRRYP